MNELIIEVNSKNKTGFGFRAYTETYNQMEIMDKIKNALKGGQVDLLVIPTNDVVKIADGLQAEYREALNNRIANPTDDKENDIAVKNTYAGIIAGITLLLNRLSV